MTHKAETIMQTVTTALTGLPTTGSRVYRGRVDPIPKAEQNAIVIFQGDDEVDEDSPFHVVRSFLTVNVEIVAREVSAQIDETLNTIRKEIAVALADPTLGLAFVESALQQEAGEPEISDDGDRYEARMRDTWLVIYRRSRLDPAN